MDGHMRGHQITRIVFSTLSEVWAKWLNLMIRAYRPCILKSQASKRRHAALQAKFRMGLHLVKPKRDKPTKPS